MKVTNRNAHMDRGGKHNDRNFDLSAAPHVDDSRTKLNKYYTFNGDTEHSFSEIEFEFYREHFTQHVEAQNQRNVNGGHPERNMTIEEYYRHKRYRPEDKILQIGNIKEHASGEELWECAMEYKDRFNQIYGDHCVILDMALHLDEATPHVHIRRVWVAEDNNGLESVNQARALEQLGVHMPKPEKYENRYNNRKITQTHTDWELFRSVCIEKGFDIEEINPEKKTQKHLDTLAYKKKELEKDIEERQRTLDSLESRIGDAEKAEKLSEEFTEQMDAMIDFFEQNALLRDMYADEIEESKKKSRFEIYEAYSKLMREDADKLMKASSLETHIIQSRATAEINNLRRFLAQKGLLDEYDHSADHRSISSKDNDIKCL